ncbi:hypothetical protein BDF19DRAFT_420908 [Syncephalis fuscata]|nr:hypothetical protein BDF19DRAFT_420908 [Syncephalis fuscata]
MPDIDYNNPENTEWIKNVTRLWGISLNPLGEKNVLDFFVEASGDIKEQRTRLAARWFYQDLKIYFPSAVSFPQWQA